MLEEMGRAELLMLHDSTQGFFMVCQLKSTMKQTGRKKPLLKIMSFILNVHSFSQSMLEIISKHTVILIHRNFSMLGLRGLNLNFLIVLHPRLQGFATDAQT